MAIAALILSVIGLILSMACVIIMVSKEYFSSHTVQLTPIESIDALRPRAKGRPMNEAFTDISDPLSDDEREYFEKQAAKK